MIGERRDISRTRAVCDDGGGGEIGYRGYVTTASENPRLSGNEGEKYDFFPFFLVTLTLDVGIWEGRGREISVFDCSIDRPQN